MRLINNQNYYLIRKDVMERRMILGLAALPVSAVLALAAVFFRGAEVLPLTDIALWAETVTGPLYSIAQKVYIMAYVLLFFGYWALYRYFSGFEKAEKFVFWGFVFSLWGIGLALPTQGVFTYVSPYLAQLFQEGNTALPDMLIGIANRDSIYLGIPAAIFYSAGTILCGLGILRTGVFPNIIPLILIPHGLLLSLSISRFPVLILAWLTLFASGFSLAYFIIVSEEEDEEDVSESNSSDFEES